MIIEIKHKLSEEILFSCEAESLKQAVETAIKRKVDLSSADLRSADLRYADLSYANLRSANLSSADLRSADLSYADLRYADLRSADLRSADLRSANLSSADLSYADLRSADLRYAYLSPANGFKFSPIQVINTRFFITILDETVLWGCKTLTFEELKSFTFQDCTQKWDEKEFEFNKKTILEHIEFYRSEK